MKLQELRTSKEMTQAELAKSCGVDQRTISAIEKGVNNPSIKLAIKLSQILGCSLDELLNTKGA